MSFIKRREVISILFYVLLTAYLFCGGGCAPKEQLNSEFLAESRISVQMRAVIDKYRSEIPIKMQKHDIPGLSIALLDNKGTLWAAGFGQTKRNGKTVVNPDTVFSIQSMSKTFTATAVMFAVQDGLVDLDVPITEYLPDFKVNSKFEEAPEKKITLRNMLNHTAGFTHEAPVGNNFDTTFDSFEEHVKSISDTWLKFRVGERSSYSNLGIDLAGYIVQVRSGISFEQYMKEKVFEPLDMPRSSMGREIIRNTENRAIGHQQHVKRVPLDMPMVGAGGVYTSANELANFVQFHINRGNVKGQSILDGKFIDEMYGVYPPSGGYGLCIGVSKKHDSYHLSHGGGGFGFLTEMRWYPEYRIGAVVLTNSSSHPIQGDISKSITDRIIKDGIVEKYVAKEAVRNPFASSEIIKVDGVEKQKESKHEPNPYTKAMKKYIGKYRPLYKGWELRLYARIAVALGYPVFIVKIYEKDGNLYIRHEGKDEALEEYQPGLFFPPSGEALDFRGPVPTWRNIKFKKM
ncbi:MAG: beta-lactamase family protein [Planctomycetes bacterium]|nr:beta-lactamase family protein [Planctomycetota bacterium]